MLACQSKIAIAIVNKFLLKITQDCKSYPRFLLNLKLTDRFSKYFQANAVTREVFDHVTRYTGVNEVQYFGLMIIKGTICFFTSLHTISFQFSEKEEKVVK